MMAWVYVPSLVLICQRAAEKLDTSCLAALWSKLIHGTNKETVYPIPSPHPLPSHTEKYQWNSMMGFDTGNNGSESVILAMHALTEIQRHNKITKTQTK